MPNHTNNNLTITGPTSDVLSFVVAVNHSDNPAPADDSVNLYLGDGNFDFNAIVPMPKELVGTTSPSYIQTQQELDDMWNDFNRRKVGGQLTDWEQKTDKPLRIGITKEYSNYLIAKFGADNWYNWAHANWGTKWGAYDAGDWEIVKGNDNMHTTATINYDTAWCPANAFFEKASKLFPTLTFETEYAEEGDGLVGATSFENGEIIEACEYDWDSDEGIVIRTRLGCEPYEGDDDENLEIQLHDA